MDVKKGDRIELVEMGEDPRPIAPGERGTVIGVSRWNDQEYQVQVDWDNGRRLHLICPPDRYVVIKKA